jgi:putative acetyltransferase
MEGLRLRKAVPEDADAMRVLFRGTVSEINSRDYSPKQIAVWAGSVEDPQRHVRLMMRIADQYFLVAELGSKMVGFCSLEKDGYLDLFYVDKDCQGRGVGTLMLKALLTEAQRLGLREITGDISTTARTFVERAGFRFERDSSSLLDGVVLTHHTMRWKP